MELYKHQKDFLEKNPDRRLLCWSTGTGKTRAAVEWSKLGGTATLFIAPKALKENWERNINEYGAPVFSRVLTKETFRRDWDDLPKFEQVVFDEAHYAAGEKSQMSKSLRAYTKKHDVQRILLLTATPYLSSPWNIYTLAKQLRVFWSWVKYRDHFFEEKYVGRREIAGKVVGRKVMAVKPGMEKDVAKCVAAIGDVVRIDECADIPEQVFETEYFEMNEEQKAALKTVYDPNPIVRYTKYHQVEGGTLKGDGYTKDQFFNPPQLERLRELVDEHRKIAVVCRYNFEIDMIRSSFFRNSKKRWDVFVIRGDVKNRDEVVQQVEAADDAVVLINAACSEGYELPSVPLMVFWSMSFSYKDYKQILGRILRLNKLKKNVYIHLLTSGVSEAVYRSIMSKKDFDIAIYTQETQREGLPDPIQPVG